MDNGFLAILTNIILLVLPTLQSTDGFRTFEVHRACFRQHTETTGNFLVGFTDTTEIAAEPVLSSFSFVSESQSRYHQD